MSLVAVIAVREGGAHTPSLLDERPIAGAESALIELVRALARRGHDVIVRTDNSDEYREDGLDWGTGRFPARVDLAIANRFPRMLGDLPAAKGRPLLWLHNTAQYLLRRAALSQLAKIRPRLIFIGQYQRRSLPPLRIFPSTVIPYGLSESFRSHSHFVAPPQRRAVFTSNPLRGLDWLLDRWVTDIRPRASGAELHLFSGPATYGAWGHGVRHLMEPVLDRANNLRTEGVVVHEPLRRMELVQELRRSRVMLYRGDRAETFCLAVAEAQAVGVPVVAQPIGSLPERIVHGVTGWVEPTTAGFADRAVSLLTDDDMWREQSDAAIDRQGERTWDVAAGEFEQLL